jgi:hypothetical protein
MSRQNAEIVREIIESINRGDFDQASGPPRAQLVG